MNCTTDRSSTAVERSDALVIGSGAAGLSAALYAQGRSVIVLSKASLARDGSSRLAQGGVAAAVGVDDSPQQHAADTIVAGCGLCDPAVVLDVVREGPRHIIELEDLGTALDRGPGGELALGREAAHGRPRIVHASGDATGEEIMRAMADAVAASPRIRVHEGMLAVDLLVDDGRVVGALTVGRDGRIVRYLANGVVLASGGVGGIYSHTTNPPESTGDGLAMAARAGARLAGLEFVQFHPTALADGSSPMALLTEALRGEGAVLVDSDGDRFMVGEHPMAELAPRDVVARAVWRRSLAGGAYLDARRLGEQLRRRFPTVMGLCRERGLDPTAELIPVAPAAHYHMGGVIVDRWGGTSVDGLWACGEAAFTGLHGANRLASNSLLEALVYGRRVGRALSANPGFVGHRWSAMAAGPPVPGRNLQRAWLADDDRRQVAAEIRDLMWQYVGLERSESGLARAHRRLEELAPSMGDGPGELHNLWTVARLVCESSRRRTESRGAHFRVDFPFTDPHWQQDLVFDGERPLAPHALTGVGVVAG